MCWAPQFQCVREKTRHIMFTSSYPQPFANLLVSFKCQGGGGDSGSWRPHNLVSVSLSVFKTKVNYLHASTWVRPIPQFNFPFQMNERNALQFTWSQSADCQLQRWQCKYFLLGTEPACHRGLMCTYTRVPGWCYRRHRKCPCGRRRPQMDTVPQTRLVKRF